MACVGRQDVGQYVAEVPQVIASRVHARDSVDDETCPCAVERRNCRREYKTAGTVYQELHDDFMLKKE